MSFVRVGRPQQHTKGKRPVRSKKATAPKKDWVSTVNDLSVHKLTSAELNHRHEIHKSHNKAAAQWELREKALKCRLKHIGSPAPLDKASLSIIREVFSDQLLLQDVLTRSDKALAVVQDLFGDAPRRQMGHPSVTMAPHCDFQSEDPSTPLSILSQSTLDQQALNELEPSDEEDSLDDASPMLNANYYVKRANVQKMNAQSRGRLKQRQKYEHRPAFDQTDRNDDPVTPCASGRAPDPSALNATVNIKGVQSRQSQSREGSEDVSVLISQVLNPELPLNKSDVIRSRTSGATRKCVSQTSELNGSSVASPSGDHSSLGLLQAMLGQVEADLDTLSPDTETASAPGQIENRKQGLIGFSVALVSTLGRLVHLFKQKEKEAHTEAQERRRLEEELREQRGLIDALSVETMALREEVTVLQTRLQRQSTEFEQKLDTVVLVIGELGLLDAHSDPHQGSDSAAVHQSAPAAERDPPQRQASVSPAVLLSPPQQRDNWQQMPGAYSVLQHREHSMNTLQPSNGMQAHNSASSLTSLPLCSLPSTSSLSLTSDPLSQLLSPDAMLAEIAQLSRQNELIKAQLSQAKDLRSVCEGSPDGISGQRRSSSSNTGRVAPQSVGERRVSDTRSTGSKSQHVQAAEGEQFTRQETQSFILPVSVVEQRLLELNKQSAAARGRLLQLIEQQKQNISAKFSPSGSPIPPSAFSPHPADGGGSPEVSVLLPEKDLLSQTSGYDRRYGGSSHNVGGERRDGKAQTEKRKEQEAWFALSAHMR